MILDNLQTHIEWTYEREQEEQQAMNIWLKEVAIY